MSSSPDNVWTLLHHDEVLGEITVAGSDFPWLEGAWAPTDAFGVWAPRFEELNQLLENMTDGLDLVQALDELVAAGVRLMPPDGADIEWLLYIEGNEARFRWHDKSEA